MLCGILEPSDGEGWVLGIDLRREPERVKSAIGYMSQRFSLYDDLTVDENLAFYTRVYEVPRAERAARIIQMMRLADLVGRERQLAGQLSGGYRQRLALSCALVHRAAPDLPRRADRRRRPGVAPDVLGADPPPRRRGHDDPGDHALHGRGRALRHARLHLPGAPDRAGPARAHQGRDVRARRVRAGGGRSGARRGDPRRLGQRSKKSCAWGRDCA